MPPTAASPSPSLLSSPAIDPQVELERQLTVLVDTGLPALGGTSAAAIRRRTARLHERLDDVAGRVFVLVLPGLVPADRLVTMAGLGGRSGFTTMDPEDLARFLPTADVDVPAGGAYILVDPDTGQGSLDVPPEVALPRLLAQGRTPLTLDEGLALVLQDGETLRHDRFSMLGSRCGDRRVPALWVSKGAPRLGWCWDGAPHTWLGSASAAARVC